MFSESGVELPFVSLIFYRERERNSSSSPPAWEREWGLALMGPGPPTSPEAPPPTCPPGPPLRQFFYYRNHMRSIWQKILAPATRRPAGIRCAMELMSRCVILMVLAGAAGQLVFPQGDRVSRWAWADDSWVYATATLHSWLSDIPETLSYCWNYLTWAATSEVHFSFYNIIVVRWRIAGSITE